MKRSFSKIPLCLLALAGTPVALAAQTVPVIEVSQGNSPVSSHVPSQSTELLLIIQQLQDEMRRLRGQVESQQFQLKRMESEQKERYRDMDRRISMLVQTQLTQLDETQPLASSEDSAPPAAAPAEAPEPAAENKPATKPAAKPAVANNDATDQADYQAAFALVRSREFTAAAEQFNQFLINHPQSPRVPNVHYWLGEIYLAQAQSEPAEKAFTQVISQFPDSIKAADAMYKLGIVYKQRGNVEQAMEYMRRVMQDYPESSAARLAESALNQ